MALIVYKAVCAIIIVLQLRTMNFIYVHGKIGGYCTLKNRTVVLNICKTPPRLMLPVCEGFCSSSTQWEFNSNRFVPRTSACIVTRHRNEQFICPDSTHTAVEIMIPLACSCNKHYCQSLRQYS
ncbi:unnamed protein product [Rotaria sordida]|uniref:Glycoprotein hormone subunit beta domain-containing protein n=1 Tax=Rotaria sordida TaxID=392033 RepID=A0A818QTX6_9BILA|nr:unnamed protein product [Rotaria sordida]